MSNRKRARRPPGQHAGAPASAVRVDDIGQACQILLDDLAAERRLLMPDSPALGRTGVALRQGIAVGSPPLPVILVEPIQTSLATRGRGSLYEMRVGIAVKLGLTLLTEAPAGPPTAANWALRLTGERLILADPTGASLAEFAGPDDHQWLAAAAQHGKVTAIYGTRIGVRRPDSVPQGRFNDHTRAAELDEFVSREMVAWGVVSFLC